MIVKVYTVRYEDTEAYSTARKAIESITNTGAYHVTYTTRDYESRIDTAITSDNVAKFITLLNKQGFLTINIDEHDVYHIDAIDVK